MQAAFYAGATALLCLQLSIPKDISTQQQCMLLDRLAAEIGQFASREAMRAATKGGVPQ